MSSTIAQVPIVILSGVIATYQYTVFRLDVFKMYIYWLSEYVELSAEALASPDMVIQVRQNIHNYLNNF